MRKKLSCAAVFVLVCGNVFAANWFTGYFDNQFTDPNNWTSGDPQNADCIINQGSTVELTAPEPFYFINSLKLGSNFSNMNTLNVNSGLLAIVNHLYIGGVGETGDGKINLHSGQISCAYLYQGYSTYGEINLTEGNINASNAFYLGIGTGGRGVVNLNGGALESKWLLMGATSQIVITGGKLKMNGNAGNPVVEIPQYIEQGWIKAGDGWDLKTEIFNGGLGIEVSATLNPCPNPPLSDANGDCKVDLADLAIMASEWLTCNLTDQSACWR